MGKDLGGIGPTDPGQARGTKQNGVAGFADPERVFGQGHAAVQLVLGTSLLEGQVETHIGARLQSAQDLLGGLHDFDANAISGQYCNVILVFIDGIC